MQKIIDASNVAHTVGLYSGPSLPKKIGINSEKTCKVRKYPQMIPNR